MSPTLIQPLNGQTLRTAREARGATGRGLAEAVAIRLGEPSRKRALSMAVSRVERGESGALDARTVAAIADELRLGERDLFEATLWAFQTPDERLAALGLSVPMWSVPEAAYESRGVLTGANGAMPDVLADARLVPTFARDRDRHLAANFADELTDAERSFLLFVDPGERTLRALWLVHVVVTSTKPAARSRAAIALRDLAAAGTLPSVDLDALYDLATRRLLCDRLRDAPAVRWAEWHEHEDNLAGAVHNAIRDDADRLTADP